MLLKPQNVSMGNKFHLNLFKIKVNKDKLSPAVF